MGYQILFSPLALSYGDVGIDRNEETPQNCHSLLRLVRSSLLLSCLCTRDWPAGDSQGSRVHSEGSQALA